MKQLPYRLYLILSLTFLFFNQTRAQLAPEPPAGYLAGQAVHPVPSPEPGLLFYLSGEQKTRADFAAGGQNLPNFLRGIDLTAGGAKGTAFSAADDQLLSYWAPGNVYAQRGTLSFFWRSRYPAGTSPFPVFRIGYADHSSWDMVWLRIDYNGRGFDAFVTDVGLARTRVSYFMDSFPRPDQWTHLALAWDETEGVRFWVNGKLAAKASVSNATVYDAGLDQFGPHSRIISPYQVQSEYNFVRGGDLDELRIYDRMLSDENIGQLYQLQLPQPIPALQRDLRERRWRDAWWTRNGWNMPNEPPPLLPASSVSIRKVEVHDAYDVRRWYWKANDGIRETTWPGVYNMSRLPGRYDYFVLPDWDTYSRSGQTIRFQLPDEPWNQVEIWGKAWGQLTYEKEHAYDTTFAVRSQQQVKSFHAIPTRQGGAIRFDNALIEEPIGELGVYHVQAGRTPSGRTTEQFTLSAASPDSSVKPLRDLTAFVNGRYPADEQTKMTGVAGMGANPSQPVAQQPALPFIHVLIPYTAHPNEGLDGIELQLPALPVQPTHGTLFPMNIRVKDPLWPMRDLADWSFSVKPGSAYTLWIDTRDRILPEDHALYITLAGAGSDLTPALLQGAVVRLVYTSKEKARLEHEPDRTTQIRDLYGFTVEERPVSTRLNLYNRFAADDADLLKINPTSFLGKAYKWVLTNNPADRPGYTVPEAPPGVPAWAYLQTQYLRKLATVLNFYIDKRQIGNGEFGGGLSDDDDFTNLLPGMALMGIEPEKTRRSLQKFIKGFYDNERDGYDAALRQPGLPLFTNGLATIKTDLLHAYEEGIEAVGQLQLIDYGNPLHLVHGMQTAKRVMEDITQMNGAGHRHFRSRFYGGTGIATEDPWQWSGANSYHVLHPAYNIVRYNGNPSLHRMIVEMADGLMAHRDKNGLPYTDIHFTTDSVRGSASIQNTWQLFKAAYDFTGDQKYLQPISSRKLDDAHPFNRDSLVKRYTERIKDLGAREFINTEGSVWIDRVVAPYNDLQTDRLGGVALARIQNIYQQHYLGWKIDKPRGYESVAVFVTRANASRISLLAYNLDAAPVTAEMTLWNIQPGRWRIRQGTDGNDDQKIDQGLTERTVDLERGESLKPLLASHKTTIIELELVTPAQTNYSQRPDLGINPEEVKRVDDTISVRVYSLGAVDAPATTLAVKDASGNRVATATVPVLKAPVDLLPKWVDVKIAIPAKAAMHKGTVELDPDKKMVQITRLNDKVSFEQGF